MPEQGWSVRLDVEGRQWLRAEGTERWYRWADGVRVYGEPDFNPTQRDKTSQRMQTATNG